ncbi:Conserved_hypothetical protein [Hexamita inflata]|uniref:Uncharacterized protein n=1 Tax=Hexamita inflata TaxID=28002 RepID=A0AA86UN69_9EUKA|nr:Conserved hypothetical protein [Hexamita inflata]
MQYRLWGNTVSIIVLQPFIDLCTTTYSLALLDGSREILFGFIQNKQKNAAKAYFACVLVNYYTVGLCISIVIGKICSNQVELFTQNAKAKYYLQIQLYFSIFGRSQFVFYREIMIIEQRVYAAFCMDILYGLLSILITCVCIVLTDSKAIQKPNYYKLFAVIELLSNFFASLYPIYSIVSYFSSPKKWDVKGILNQNPLKLRLCDIFPFRFQLIQQIFVRTLPYLFKHAIEPILCSGIMYLYHKYQHLQVWSEYGIIGCQMTRIFSQAASSLSSQSESQLRFLFNINIKTGNVIRIREVLMKGARIVFCVQFVFMIMIGAIFKVMVQWYFVIQDPFALKQAIFKKWALTWCVLVPYHFAQPLVEMEFGYFQTFQVAMHWTLFGSQFLVYYIKKKRTEFNNMQVQLMIAKALIGLIMYIKYVLKYTKLLNQKKMDPS